MPRGRTWSDAKLRTATQRSKSIREVISRLNLIPAGGNYQSIKARLTALQVPIEHFTGSAWNKGLRGIGKPRRTLEDILVRGSAFQSFKLKKRLFLAGLKQPQCEECGWAKIAKDGRIPVELDHINGDHSDNRIENLRILCPNCHSLQATHRGKNKSKVRVAKLADAHHLK